MWKTILTMLASPVIQWLGRRQDRKDIVAEVNGKIAVSKQRGESIVTIGTESWEALKASQEGGTWKDEYVTIVITAPIVLIIIGSAVQGITGDSSLLDAGLRSVQTLQESGIPMGNLMVAVVTAAISLKVLRS